MVSFTSAAKILLYYLAILFYIMILGYYLYDKDYLTVNTSYFRIIVNALVATSLPYLVMNLIGLLSSHPFKREDIPNLVTLGEQLPHRLYVRIVTRGTNPNLVQKTVNHAYSVMSILPASKFQIEVVTDTTNCLNPIPRVTEIIVPESYECSTRFKGRALQYAIEHSDAELDDWIIHLDEETRFNTYTLQNMILHTFRHDNSIGQGVITYGSRRVESMTHMMTTLADSIRVTDDFGRFRFQYAMNTSLFGMKGSYIVIRNAVEKVVGFDHGRESSVTEDAFFALYARGMGIPFRFIPGLMYERSPFNFSDFIKQRKRWFIGLWLVCSSSRIPLWYRKELIFCMVLWLLQPISYISILVNFMLNLNEHDDTSVTPFVELFINPFMFFYVVGFLFSIDRHSYTTLEYCGLGLIQVLMIPVFTVLEFSGIVYSFLKWDAGFFIVQKEVEGEEQPLLEDVDQV
jgi:egghead protein (zeste-white 4 protein)